ncbi:MAG: YcjX family protein [Pseudomonadota bacterium]
MSSTNACLFSSGRLLSQNPILSVFDEAKLTLESFGDFVTDQFDRTLRIGVTGLSRSGKTVFITALVQALVGKTPMPLFGVKSEGRLARAEIRPQPDLAVPRFQAEEHLKTLAMPNRSWPESTRQISEIRIVLHFETTRRLIGGSTRKTLTLDIVDYPGEWLLDLGLLAKDYRTWSEETLALTKEPTRAPIAEPWLEKVRAVSPLDPDDEPKAEVLSDAFKTYLHACRDARVSQSTLPPGRFLMPGDLEGSPALTFSPLPSPAERPGERTLHALMAKRFEAYKDLVVRPFFVEHFAKLDRQIVLVDLLSAMNAGPNAVRDLERALSDTLSVFRTGRRSLLSALFARRISKILFAATKADLIHHANHDRLETLLAALVSRSRNAADMTGTEVGLAALSSVRATRETIISRDGADHECIVGTPESGEIIGGKTFDGEKETAFFPGDLPDDIATILDPKAAPYTGLESLTSDAHADLRFLKFRPPEFPDAAVERRFAMPHIRLDKALQFLIGDAVS